MSVRSSRDNVEDPTTTVANYGADQTRSAARVLRRSWPQWMEIVALNAHRRRARKRVRVDDYRELHNAILEACGILAQGADDRRRVLYGEVANLVRPWVTPESLSFADRQLMMRLLARCQEAQRQLTGRSQLSAVWRKGLTLVVMVFVLGAGTVMVAPHLKDGGAAVLPVSEEAESLFYLARYHFRRTTVMQRVAVGGALITVLTIAVVWKSAKNY